jgi:hypothetical protein
MGIRNSQQRTSRRYRQSFETVSAAKVEEAGERRSNAAKIGEQAEFMGYK